jgi:hypothetical protein
MPLDLYLAGTADHLILGTLEPRLSLPESGLTGLLLAIQEFTGPSTAHGGPTLDECGTNVFGRADLPRLRESLFRAAAHVREGPSSFQVWVGREVIPLERDLFQEVTREQVLSAVLGIHRVVEEAIQTGSWLFAVGESPR